MNDLTRNSLLAGEINPLGMNGGDYHAEYAGAPTLDWADKRLARVTRVRILTDYQANLADLKYAHGVMKDGTVCNVRFGSLNDLHDFTPRNFKGQILKAAKRDGVYAKGIALFEAISTL